MPEAYTANQRAARQNRDALNRLAASFQRLTKDLLQGTDKRTKPFAAVAAPPGSVTWVGIPPPDSRYQRPRARPGANLRVRPQSTALGRFFWMACKPPFSCPLRPREQRPSSKPHPSAKAGRAVKGRRRPAMAAGAVSVRGAPATLMLTWSPSRGAETQAVLDELNNEIESAQQRERGAAPAGAVADVSPFWTAQREGCAGNRARGAALRAGGGGASTTRNHGRVTAE